MSALDRECLPVQVCKRPPHQSQDLPKFGSKMFRQFWPIEEKLGLQDTDKQLTLPMEGAGEVQTWSLPMQYLQSDVNNEVLNLGTWNGNGRG